MYLNQRWQKYPTTVYFYGCKLRPLLSYTVPIPHKNIPRAWAKKEVLPAIRTAIRNLDRRNRKKEEKRGKKIYIIYAAYVFLSTFIFYSTK